MKKLIAVYFVFFTWVLLAQTNVAHTNALAPFGLVVEVPTVSTNVPVHVLPVVQQAQDQLSQYLVMIIPVVVPLLIAGLKKWIPNIPTWTLPILAPGLGALADFVLQSAGVQTGGTLKGMLLGSAGVGIRELQNQVALKMNTSRQAALAPPAPPISNPATKPTDNP